MKKQRKDWKRISVSALLAGTVALSNFGVVLPVQAADHGVAVQDAGENLSDLEPAAWSNPVVQSYEADMDHPWKLTSGSRFIIEATQENVDNERLAEVVKLVNAEFADKGIVSSDPFTMVYGMREDMTPADVLIVLDTENPICDESDSDEAYRIEIGENGAVLTAASENAVMYGLRTIQTMMISNDNLVYGTITDYPDVAERRLHVDCARKYITKDWFIRQIREMSYMKLNTLEMHFSENLGFRIECETDPSIVSDQYLRKEEVREILAEAKKYGINVIPSFDSPGHVDQILRAHPEYGQVDRNGNHYASGLDVTNPEAVEYIKSLYREYMELFEGCTDFHIGGDEYMEFDRAPFTTQYQSVLDSYAQERWGDGYTWKDAIANYINEIAELVYEGGFTPRIFNDGVYYGENTSTPQRIQMHDYIGIDYWSQMGWNRSISTLQILRNHGFDTFYNFNSSYFYYVLRNDMPTDGRAQASFDVLNQDRNIFENWTPGQFPSASHVDNTVPDDSDFIAGVSMGIWCDNPNIVTEDQITDDIADELRAMASKSWNTSSNSVVTFDEFQENYMKLGHAAAYEKGSILPDAGEIQESDSMGKVTMNYVSDTGKVLKDPVVRYGMLDEAYSFTADEIYGYRLVSEGSVSGTYSKEGAEYTFTYTLDTDKSELQERLDSVVPADSCIAETYGEYAAAIEAARPVYEDEMSEQTAVDDAVSAIDEAQAKLVSLSDFALYVETQYPLQDTGYSSGYSAYQEAVAAAQEVLYAADSTTEQKAQALADIETAKDGLMRPDGNTPDITASKEAYSYYYLTNMIDGNTDTKYWANGSQIAGENITFTFPQAVNMSAIRIVQPSNVGADVMNGADVQVAGTDGVWTTVGQMRSDSLDSTYEFEPTTVKQVRILITEDKKNWYQIAEVYFTYEQIEEDSTLKDLILEAEQTDITDKDVSKVQNMITALIAAQKAYGSGAADTEQVIANLRGALNELSVTQPASDAAVQALQTMVDQAKALGSDDEALKAAIAAAEAVLAKEAPTATEVVSALLDLSEALQAINESADTDALRADVQATIDFINENVLTKVDNIRPGKVQALRDAVASAQELLKKPEASAEQLQAANKAMTKAAQELWEIVSKAELEDMISAANSYLSGEYTQESKDALQAAITAAQAVADNEDATTAEVTNAINAIADAIAALESEALDKTALQFEIDIVASMVDNIDDYIPSTVIGLQDKLAQAQDVLANATTQKELDDASNMLLEARLSARTKADKTALNTMIAQVNALDLSLYEAGGAEALNTVLSRAQNIYADPNATQNEVDAVVTDLKAKLDALVPLESETAKPSVSTDKETDESASRSETAKTGTRSGMSALLAMLALSGGMMILPGLRRKKSENQ